MQVAFKPATALKALVFGIALLPLARLAAGAVLSTARRQPGGVHHSEHRRLDAAFPAADACGHAAAHHVFDLAETAKDILKRPFITVGFNTLVLMLPLAVTSTNKMVRRLGAKRWMALHRLVCLIAPLGVLHFWWMVKKDVSEPALYAAALAELLGYRLAAKLYERRRVQNPAPGTSNTSRVSPAGNLI